VVGGGARSEEEMRCSAPYSVRVSGTPRARHCGEMECGGPNTQQWWRTTVRGGTLPVADYECEGVKWVRDIMELLKEAV
jgi:hypothetical protein